MIRTDASAKVNALAQTLANGDRRALAQAITLVESTKVSDLKYSEDLLAVILPLSGKSVRVGISGAPGAGKSTFIEAFGKFLTARGHKVAVLAIDPSSRRSGGSILGDKTRMESLARDPHAFIRPSPAGEALGGVARRTRESILLVEAAGFDVVLIETVGVGQSETAVADMTDLFVLLQSPGGGDDLQGIKRGVMELADVVLVTKADGDLVPAARRAVADFNAALHLIRPKHDGLSPEVLTVSAVRNEGIDQVWRIVHRLHDALKADGRLDRLRREQFRRWFWTEVESAIREAVLGNPRAARQAANLEDAVVSGRALPYAAARALVTGLRGA
jgi:LAO/AO transport system kinase